MRKVAWMVLVIVGLVGLAWAFDSYARSATEQRVAAGVADSTGGRAAVTAAGFPFLPQLVAGELEHLDMVIPELTLAGLRMEDAHVVATGVTTRAPHTVSSLTATATVRIAEVDRLFTAASGMEAHIAIRGESLAVTREVLGQEVAVVFRPELVDGGLSLTPEELTLGERSLDISRLEDLLDGLAGDVLLPVELPEGLRIAALEVLGDGVRLQVEGTDFAPDEALFR